MSAMSEEDRERFARMIECLRNQETEEGRMQGYRFQPTKEDVLIVSPPKCGTTWVCQIVQSLRSRGSMDFDEINMVIPCLEMAVDSGYKDLDAPQGWLPRTFKTHWWYPHCPKGAGKTVFICRDPLEAGPSFYHFMNGWVFDDGEVSQEEFIRELFLKRGEAPSPMVNASIWHTILTWFPHRLDPDVLWLHYEDLHEDLPAAVRLVAEHIGVGAGDAELQAIAVEQGSIEFMRAHPTKYDEHSLKRARNVASGRPADAGMGRTTSGKVREGKLGANKQQLSPELHAAIEYRWREVLLPATGYASYEEMRRGVNRELGRPFCKS